MKSRGKRGIRKKKEMPSFKNFIPYIILVVLVLAVLAILFINYKGLLGNIILNSQGTNSERVNLVSLPDGTRVSNLSQTFNCNANSSMNNVANMTLFVYNSSGQNVALEVQRYSSIYSFNISNTVFDMLPSDFTFDSNGNFYHLDFFTLFKYSPKGIFLQSVDLSRYFDNSYGKGNAVTLTTDSSNNVYVVGVQRGVLITPLKIIKFDSNGNFLKSTIVNSLSSLSQVAYNPSGITADSFGNIYITGCSVSVPISSSCTIGSCVGCPGAQFWVTKYNSNLSYGGWQNIFGAQQGCFSSIYDIHGLTADSLNNIYLVGETLLSPVSSFPVSSSALFIKYNSSGQQLFCNSWNPVSNNKYSTIPSNNIVFDPAGNVYIAGQTASSNWISKFDSSGNHSWDRLFSGSGQPVIVRDNSMNLYVSTSNGIFTKYDTLGNIIDSTNYLNSLAPTLASRDYLLSALYSYSGITKSYSVLSVKVINFNLFLGGLPQFSWNFTLPYQGDYKWNCKTCDLFNNCTMSSTNHTLSTPPACTSFSYSDWEDCQSDLINDLNPKSDSFAISARINTTNATFIQSIYSRWAYDDVNIPHGFELAINHPSSQTFAFWDGVHNWQTISSGIQGGKEYQIIIIREGTVLTFYTDGELKGSINITSNIPDVAFVNSRIGRSNYDLSNDSSLTRPFLGTIKNSNGETGKVDIYDRALSADEVKSFSPGRGYGQQTRAIISSFPSGCSGGSPITLQSCTYVPPCTESNWNYSITPRVCPSSGRQTKHWDKIGTCTGGISHPNSEQISCTYVAPICTSFTYSNWGICYQNGTQTRTITSSSPSECINGNPVTLQSCTPLCIENNWNYSLSPLKCPSSGQQVKHWDKIGTCTGGISHPNSEQVSCTYIAPSLVGNVNNVSTNIASLSFSINGTSNISDSEILKEFMKIEFKNNNRPLLEFNHNFSAHEFDFTKVKMKTNRTSNVSSVVISGLNDTKSIYIDLVGNRSKFNSLCIKDAEINDFGEISRYCNGTSEIYIKSIPYVLGRYSVEYTDSSNLSAIVKGLMHSGVSQQCTENWQCSDWSVCSNSLQTRTCNDSNNCGSINSIPNLTQGCTMGSSSGLSGSGSSGGGGDGSYSGSSSSKNTTNTTNLNVGSLNQSNLNPSAPAINISEKDNTQTGGYLNTNITLLIFSTALAIAVVIIIIVIIYIYRKRKNSLDNNSGSVFYAAKRLYDNANNSGYSNEQIRQSFRDKGWTDKEIDELSKDEIK